MRWPSLVSLAAMCFSLTAADSPQVAFSRLFANLGDGNVSSVATDAAGNIYLAGFTRTPGAVPLVRPLQARGNVFLIKFDPGGTNILFSTMLGAGLGDTLGGMTVDAAGNAYLAGTTGSQDFPTVNAFQPRPGSRGGSAWAMKIDPTGQTVLYSTYLGGSIDTDFGMSIAVDAHGRAYVAGLAQSTDFPVTPGAYLAGVRGHFVAKISEDGQRLMYSTLIDQ